MPLAMAITELNPEELEVFSSRVDAGISLLDQHVRLHTVRCDFHGWREKLELDKLNISLSHRCVLGQISGRYGIGAEHLGYFAPSDNPRLSEFGFIGCLSRQNADCYGNQCQAVWEQFAALPRLKGNAPVQLLTATWHHKLSNGA